MAGKRQHFIPQFIQEGFASHRKGKESYTWVYHRENPAFNSNIKNIGVEGRFYTEGEDTEVDELITSAETDLSELITALKSGDAACLSDPRIPQLLAHLEVRTRHLRENFLRAGDYLVTRLLDFMSEEEAFAAYLEKTIEHDPMILRDAFEKELASQKLPKEYLEPAMEMAMPLVPFLLKRNKREFGRIAAGMRAVLPDVLRKAAKLGHIGGLKKSIAPDSRVNRYQELIYRIEAITDRSLVLGDSIILLHVAGPKQYKTFLDKSDTLKAILLPLESGKVLIGARPGYDEIPPGLCEAIARCSLEYFISAETSPAVSSLAEIIGSDAGLISQEEMEEMVTQAIF